mgnify:CR=1 FL=1
MSTSKSSPFKIDPITIAAVSWGISALGTIVSGVSSSKKARIAAKEAEEKEIAARKEMQRMKNIYAGLDTSNPYLNMENKMEELTVNQKQAQFEAQQFQQSQANILDTMRGAAGGSGIAAVAQALAQQGQLASQKASASIGAQEAMNQKLKAQEASRIQGMQRAGQLQSQQMEMQKQATLLGLSAQEAAAYHQQRMQAEQQATTAAQSGFESVLGSITQGVQTAGQLYASGAM